MRTLIPVLLVAVAALAGSAAAATTVLGSRALGSGRATVGACDGDGFTFQNRLDPAGSVTAVNVSGIDAACAGGTLALTLAGSTGAAVGAGSGALPVSGFGGSLVVAVTPQPAVGAVAAYRLAITGP
jgi:hypothetical protein